MICGSDYEIIAQQWIRAARGKRSQRGLSKRLGYESNVLYRWETGRAHPPTATVFSMMNQLGGDVAAALHSFYGGHCPWLERVDPTTREGVAHLLEDLRGRSTIVSLAEKSGYSRYQVTRWLQSANEPRLHEFLTLVEACTGRVLDFIASFFGPQTLPAVASSYHQLVAVRAAAYEYPESHLVLRALELEAYQKLCQHQEGWLAQRTGLSCNEEHRALSLLAAAGQIEFDGSKWQVIGEGLVDTRSDAERSRKLRAHWMDVGKDALLSRHEGSFGYNLFSISTADLKKVADIHRRYFQEISEVIAQSSPNEEIALFSTQLFSIGPGPDGPHSD